MMQGFPGIPGGPELLIILIVFSIAFLPTYLVYRGAKRRGSNHRFAWATMMFFSSLSIWGIVIFGVFYLVVRDDIGTVDV